ncbi:MAG: 3-phosphoshikimate 1-carboxyvinyltransferase [Selenomonadaceae bacterium]|nr:3-phosphoshikimate 1-carboxyvinyltransferase [Selenomonadaceae bacterium]
MKKILPLTHGLRGTIKIPGDKSISHRSVILSSLATTPVEVTNFLAGADCLSTVACMKALGATIERAGEKLLVTGNGLHGLREAENVLDAGNSGTTLRLLMGLCAPQKFLTTFTGDNSLRRRPMARVIKPLAEAGALIVGRNSNQNLPITILPAEKNLRGIRYEMPVASAQVKSAILLAGLFASEKTTVVEPAPSRNHTEKMLSAFGARLERRGNEITISPAENLHAPEKIFVPGDISSAAYWIVLATILDGSDVTIQNVGVNETRTGIVDVLIDMGATIELVNERTSGGEKFADVHVVASKLRGVEFGGEMIPRLIDEIPALAVAAAFAQGTTVIRDVSELRVKESDRLAAIVDEFNKISPDSFSATDDSLTIRGGREKIFANCKTRADHRMAMSLAIFGAASNGVTLDDETCVDISYPNFFDMLEVNASARQ